MHPVLICQILFLLLRLGMVRSDGQWTPKDNYLIDCGATRNSTVDGRLWQADDPSSFVSAGLLASTIIQNSDLPSAIYLTGRFFTSQTAYTFAVSPGRHWIRLHFYPFSYMSFNPATSNFSVLADQYVLMADFSPALELNSTKKTYLVKEYTINSISNKISINFVPSAIAANAYAFVNGIEVVSMPDDSFIDDNILLGRGLPVQFGLAGVAMETMYRINVGGQAVNPANDSGQARTWLPDNTFLLGAALGVIPPYVNTIQYTSTLPEYIAPPSVYGTARTMGVSNIVNSMFNLTWIFPVDPSYTYYVRFHFCEIVYSALYQRIFNVYINNETAYRGLDLLAKVPSADVPFYLDVAAPMLTQGSSTMRVQIGPTPGSSAEFHEAILNGLEIMKMNNSQGSLAALVEVPAALVAAQVGAGSGEGKGKGRALAVVAGVIAGLAAALALLVGVSCLVRSRRNRRRQPSKQSSSRWLSLPFYGSFHSIANSSKASSSRRSKSGSIASVASYHGGRFFSFHEILEATNSFDESLLLGVGGFGKVYKGDLFDGTRVAVKRGNTSSGQGMTEFQTEIEMLSKLRHRHLVSLIGYCEENCEMILVYDHMANGPLRGHLYGSNLPSLSWKQRLDICIGAARGLHYLHTGAAQGIIHRDVKTTNILLDENFVAKVSDFGLSKTGPSLDHTHVSTAVKGSFGYLDPEYFRRQHLTEKSDVYSFGVVLMEVLCARPVINPTLPRDQVNIVDWAMHWQKMGKLEQIIDPFLRGQIDPESLHKFGETAEKCLAEEGIDRPAMGDILWNLEYVLQLQESAIAIHRTGLNGMTSPQQRGVNSDHYHVEDGEQDYPFKHSVNSEYSEDAHDNDVFSELVSPKGR
ncbi:hypothetical protein O6H91_04G046400 [Diphasiastrum complanatum]|uniref:Uncharacterized protein n=2 Tax=Diphasiastrum complanatum TaxID=34168 RepID=A0ACC2DW48_DIPCM|nr:hypothetical protein O6H91_04G045800 [Diphasiastrum complanatum]KAJ7558565.1 hypothetical protein O6H91_04G046400 [Diphasiastrum complanatum]